VSLLESAITIAPDREGPSILGFRRFALALGGFVALPPILLAAFVLVVDPYYVFGSPSLPGINVVRPFYELHVIAAKPYQVQRIKPAAVSLGSSRVEVGLDPRHPGWADRNVFNFGLPSATSYEVMLAFLHAQAVGQPLKQAVVGLDFFGFNIFLARNQEEWEARFTGNGSRAFADFLATELASRPRGGSATGQAEARANEPADPQQAKGTATPADHRVTETAGGRPALVSPAAEPPDAEAWNEAIYLALHPDVAVAVARKEFKSGHEHYLLAGRAEGRESGMAPGNWNDALYLKLNPDVAAEVQRGTFLSGYHHFLANGRAEGRESGLVPSDWNEALYLRFYPDVAAEVQRGTFLSGYHHFLANGRAEGRESGLVPSDWNDALYLRFYPDVAAEVRRGTFVNGYHHYLVAGRAEGRYDGRPRTDWNEAQYLKMYPDVAAEVRRGTFVNGYHHYLVAGRAEGREDGTPPPDWNEALYLRLYPDVAAEVKRGRFLSGYHHYLAAGRAEGRNAGKPSNDWNEELYLRANPDVQREVTRGAFLSGYHHYLVAGRSEKREGGFVPRDWDEAGYLQINPDVQYHISQGFFLSGYHHYLVAGRAEKRSIGGHPAGWNEAGYLAVNPAARARIALGDYGSGYLHYVAVGRDQGLLGGFPPSDVAERLRLRWPGLNQAMFQFGERFRLIFSTTAVRDSIATVLRQSEPPSFDHRGMRVWGGQDNSVVASGGAGGRFRANITGWRWYLWLRPPRYMYCFTNTETGMTMFDPYRFMLHQAYAEGTDLRLYLTPLHAAVRKLIEALGLGERYVFWVRELVRINAEEAARAGREPLPLWDFSEVNAITGEPIPAPADLTPMRWYWDFSHYRKGTGDLILDRLFDHSEVDRRLPADFGVRLTPENVDRHLARSESKLASWSEANAELASRIVAAARDPKAENRQSQATCW
jgi:hypothetical protein